MLRMLEMKVYSVGLEHCLNGGLLRFKGERRGLEIGD